MQVKYVYLDRQYREQRDEMLDAVDGVFARRSTASSTQRGAARVLPLGFDRRDLARQSSRQGARLHSCRNGVPTPRPRRTVIDDDRAAGVWHVLRPHWPGGQSAKIARIVRRTVGTAVLIPPVEAKPNGQDITGRGLDISAAHIELEDGSPVLVDALRHGAPGVPMRCRRHHRRRAWWAGSSAVRA